MYSEHGNYYTQSVLTASF